MARSHILDHLVLHVDVRPGAGRLFTIRVYFAMYDFRVYFLGSCLVGVYCEAWKLAHATAQLVGV